MDELGNCRRNSRHFFNQWFTLPNRSLRVRIIAMIFNWSFMWIISSKEKTNGISKRRIRRDDLIPRVGSLSIGISNIKIIGKHNWTRKEKTYWQSSWSSLTSNNFLAWHTCIANPVMSTDVLLPESLFIINGNRIFVCVYSSIDAMDRSLFCWRICKCSLTSIWQETSIDDDWNP